MKQAFIDFWNWLTDFLYSLVLSAYEMAKDIFFWIVEILFSLTALVLDILGGMIQGLDITGYISALPPEVGSLMRAIGLAEAMGMIVTCLIIRLVMQLIPFVRLGS